MSDPGPTLPDDLLRLIALDTDDLAILSAHVQDAILRVKDINWLPREKHFVLVMNRFVWEFSSGGARRRRDYQRRRTVLHFARVEKVQSLGIKRGSGDVLDLLSVTFEPTDAPSGGVVLYFAGGATIRLSVEVLEVELTDLGPAWSTQLAPRHPAA